MKILITGANGQLGKELQLKLQNEDVHLIDRDNLDICDEVKIKTYIIDNCFDVVFHCAAWTQVDLAETERENCYRVNVLGTKYIAEACQTINAKLIYLSTDYVFDGKGTHYREVEEVCRPLNYYGQTKFEGEHFVQQIEKHFIVRISWVFGLYGKNFVETMLKLGSERSELSVVNDQIGSPTFTFDLADLLIAMCHSDKYGVYHATNEGECSWYEFAKYIFEVANMDVVVHPVSSEQFKTIAVRPKNSRLSKTKLIKNGFNLLPHWQDAVKRYLDWRK